MQTMNIEDTADAIARVKAFLLSLQDNICQTLELADGKGSFEEDTWERVQGGGGRSRVMKNASFRHGIASRVGWPKLSGYGRVIGDPSTQPLHSNIPR